MGVTWVKIYHISVITAQAADSPEIQAIIFYLYILGYTIEHILN